MESVFRKKPWAIYSNSKFLKIVITLKIEVKIGTNFLCSIRTSI